MDRLSPEKRSALMSTVRNRDTKPEMVVRRTLHALGYRYRLHRADLPGKPDIVFPGRKKIIFVHGCFWHGHKDCKFAKPPKSRMDYWLPKLERNRLRDEDALAALQQRGWGVLVVWECEIKREPQDELATTLIDFLGIRSAM
jgi:DNA mismatch endonuclease (patch repair protein)